MREQKERERKEDEEDKEDQEDQEDKDEDEPKEQRKVRLPSSVTAPGDPYTNDLSLTPRSKFEEIRHDIYI